MSERVPLLLRALEGETRDAICGVKVLQSVKGYRFNLDPILLADFAASGGLKGKVIDLGCGSGILPLVLARKYGARNVTGLELQPRLFALAQRNVQLNRFERKVSLVLGDLRRVRKLLPATGFDHVVCNPPYQDPAAGSPNRVPERALSRELLAASLDDVCAAARHLLTSRGSFSLIFPAKRLHDLFAALGRQELSAVRVRPVYPREGRPAIRVLVEAGRASSRPLEVLPPLVLHRADGQAYTDEVQQMTCEAPLRSRVRRRALALAARTAVLH
jgi:tRNA1Val (adenine37-N6)-methyltransferase